MRPSRRASQSRCRRRAARATRRWAGARWAGATGGGNPNRPTRPATTGRTRPRRWWTASSSARAVPSWPPSASATPRTQDGQPAARVLQRRRLRGVGGRVWRVERASRRATARRGEAPRRGGAPLLGCCRCRSPAALRAGMRRAGRSGGSMRAGAASVHMHAGSGFSRRLWSTNWRRTSIPMVPRRAAHEPPPNQVVCRMWCYGACSGAVHGRRGRGGGGALCGAGLMDFFRTTDAIERLDWRSKMNRAQN